MFLRPEPTMTVADLRDEILPDQGNVITLNPEDVEISVTDERVVRLGDVEVPFTNHSYQPLGKWLDVPYKFLERQDRDFQQVILTHLLQQTKGEVAVEYTDEAGVLDVRDPGVQVIDPRRMVDIASRVIAPEATVVEAHVSPESIQFDVVAPEGFDRGWGGDPAVGDITAGGLRFGQNRKRNLAPWVQRFFYRLACTNGYETLDNALKVDARGQTVQGLLHNLEERARTAFASIEGEIEAFYALRDEAVADPSQAVLRMASEVGLPQRTVMALIERVPEVIGESGASMFDVVNLITNQANDPDIRGRLNVRRSLEQAGGAQVSEHIARCRACASRLN